MNNEKGPHYEMPDEFSLEKYESVSDAHDNLSLEGKDKKKFTHKKKIIMRIVAIVAAVALIVTGIVVLSKSNIMDEFYGEDENVIAISIDDLEIEYFGYDGNGAITVTINFDKVKARVLKAMGYDENETSVGIIKEAEAICNSYRFKLCNPDFDYTDKDFSVLQDNDVNEKLTNGDIVKIVMYNLEDRKNELEEMLGETVIEETEIVLKFKEVTYTVDGFNDLVTIDIFKDVNIYTTGEDGSLSVEVEYTGDIEGLGSEVFTVTGENGSLKYGDSVVISISKDTESAIKLCDGIKLERNTMEYIIEE